jgi:hypothetical protein
MSKVYRPFDADTFIRTALKIEKKEKMNEKQKATFRKANLYRAIRRELYLKKGI